MIFLLAFWLFLFGALAIGWQAGDRHDRKVIAAIAAAAILTAAAHMLVAEATALPLVLLIDVALLAVVGAYALRSERHWPIWFAGFHATAVLFGIIALALPEDQHLVAERVGAFWSLPALLALAIGLYLDKRREVAHAPR